jgi:RNA polymerase sigma factor (sigma-70 family)
VFEVAEIGSVPPPRQVAGAEAAPAFPGDVGKLFSSYRAYVAKIGRRILGPSNEVEDLIQDVFLATVRDIHKLEDPARLSSWLATVTTRMARRRRFRNSVRPAPGPEEIRSNSSSAPAWTRRARSRARIWPATSNVS